MFVGNGGGGVPRSVTLQLRGFRSPFEVVGGSLFKPVIPSSPDNAALVGRQVATPKLVRVYPVHRRVNIRKNHFHRLKR